MRIGKYLILGLGLLGIYLGVNVQSKRSFDKIENQKNVIKEKVDLQIETLTLEEKIGQMLIPSYRMDILDDTVLEELRNYQPGGFILFKENFTKYEQTLQLIETVESTAKIPIVFTIDQEGGRVQRLQTLEDQLITKIPSMAVVGKTKNKWYAYQIGKVLAEELQVFGISMDFAPVLDIVTVEGNQVIGDRSFGNDVSLVTEMGISLAQGLQDYGVIPVYKHFPGHGSTITDSHYDLPVITKTKEELLISDLVPFQQAIEQGAEVIMVGHLAVPSITGDTIPASLSKKIITDLLKQEMGYQGLVVTDALNMKALTKNYSEKEIYELAINAGVDWLLMPVSLESAVELIKESIAEGKIDEERINQSVSKILTLKYSRISNEKQERKQLGSLSHQKIINQLNE